MAALPRWLTSPATSMVLLIAVAVALGVLVHWMFDAPSWVVGTVVGLVCGVGASQIAKRAMSPAERETDAR